MTPGPLQNYACGRLDWPFLSQVLAVTVMQKADRHSSDAAGYIPMKNQVGQVRSFLPYSDATIAGTCWKLRVIAGHLESGPAGAPSRFGLAIGPFGL